VVEQLIRNQQVVSSILTAGSTPYYISQLKQWAEETTGFIHTALAKRHEAGLFQNYFLQSADKVCY
jgi:hypothetical protein